MEFSRPEYWSGQPFTSPGDLHNPGIELRSPTLQADSLPAKPAAREALSALSRHQARAPCTGSAVFTTGPLGTSPAWLVLILM